MRLIPLFGITLIFASCSGSGPSGTTSKSDLPNLLPGVKIVYSANLNGEIEPCGCRAGPIGGLSRRWNWLEKHGSGEKLSIDSGDLFYPSAPVPPLLEKQWSAQAEALVAAYNTMAVEAVAPGELDFAAGLAAFEALRSKARFKFLSANLHRREGGGRYLDETLILVKGGKKVGLFGLYDEGLDLPAELEARDHVAAARDAVSKLHRAGAEVIVALTHLGQEKDEALARQIPGIDAIFGAHSHSFLLDPIRVGDTVILQPSYRGQHIGIYENGDNGLYQIDDRFDSPEGAPNPMEKLVAATKARIAELNRRMEQELDMPPSAPKPKKRARPAFQTFAQCATCHVPQYDFHKDTAHFRAYATLVAKGQHRNLDCLKCHTVGLDRPGGYQHVDKVVLNSKGKAIEPASFVKSLPSMTPGELGKSISKAFVNVQCETCHGAGGEHPAPGASSLISKAVRSSTCLECHTPERAPGWYRDGKPNHALIAAKLKSVSCPTDR